MTESLAYVIVGRGRWAARMHAILAGEGRRVTSVPETRRCSSEQESTYRERLCSSFRATAAHIAWLCIPPGDHIPIVVAAAVESGLHVVVEKPWFCSREDTALLETLAKARRLILAIHYEYCMMEQAQTWRRQWHPGTDLQFHGRMKLQRLNHTGLSALENPGSHLFSIHEYCVADSTIAEMDCAYEQPDERCVWLEKHRKRVAEIDLLANREPIIQRFIARVEAATQGAEFPFDLQFALRVAERILHWRQQQVP